MFNQSQFNSAEFNSSALSAIYANAILLCRKAILAASGRFYTVRSTVNYVYYVFTGQSLNLDMEGNGPCQQSPNFSLPDTIEF